MGEPPVEGVSVKVRMGVHTGEARARDGDYYGSALNRAARLMAVGHGGQIVCSQATADLARDALVEGVVLVDLGEHRLRDLSRPERLFQVNAPGLAGTFAPLRSLDAFPSNLPAQLSSFVGRERDVAEIAEVLREKRLVTLTGVGGVGKTRLGVAGGGGGAAPVPGRCVAVRAGGGARSGRGGGRGRGRVPGHGPSGTELGGVAGRVPA